jgi:hypothetical protein
METILTPIVAVSPLRQRLIDEEGSRFGYETQRNYIRDVARFTTFPGRPSDTATAEDERPNVAISPANRATRERILRSDRICTNVVRASVTELVEYRYNNPGDGYELKSPAAGNFVHFWKKLRGSYRAKPEIVG